MWLALAKRAKAYLTSGARHKLRLTWLRRDDPILTRLALALERGDICQGQVLRQLLKGVHDFIFVVSGVNKILNLSFSQYVTTLVGKWTLW
jgi:hypothetical protein